MNRDELLTKLAMELGEWPGSMNMPAPPIRGAWTNHGAWECFAKGDNTPITRTDWLARRAELINKPSWDDAPGWATHLCQRGDGQWKWYPQEPRIEDTWNTWIHDAEMVGGQMNELASIGHIPTAHDWRQTLEGRPFASVIRNSPTRLTDAITEPYGASTTAFDDQWAEDRADTIGQNGNDGDHYAVTLTHGELPAEEKHDRPRCGGSYYSPPHDECLCQSGRSDGSTASYYELPPGATELQDLISYRNLNAQDGEIFRAIYRKGRASHSDALRDAKKVLFYAEAEVERLERYGR